MGSESIAHEAEGQLKLDFNPFLPPKSRRFSILVDNNIYSSSSTNQKAALIIDY